MLFCSLSSYGAHGRVHTVGISQLVEHPSLDEIRAGLMEGLIKNEGFKKEDLNFKYFNAQGDMVTSGQIAGKLIGDRPDVVVGITTPSAQHLLAKKSKIPVVFTGVNDPVSARLVPNLEKPGGYVSGVMLVSPVKEQLELVLKIKPSTKKIAILFNSGEDNSVHIAEVFKAEAKALKLVPVLTSINQSSQIRAATQSLVGKVDALFLPTDNTVISSLGTILQVSQQGNLPVFASDVASATQGAIAALGLDHYEMGLITAKMVARILRGEKPGNIPVLIPQKNSLYLNLSLADDKMGLSFPVSVLNQADKLYTRSNAHLPLRQSER